MIYVFFYVFFLPPEFIITIILWYIFLIDSYKTNKNTLCFFIDFYEFSFTKAEFWYIKHIRIKELRKKKAINLLQIPPKPSKSLRQGVCTLFFSTQNVQKSLKKRQKSLKTTKSLKNVEKKYILRQKI